MYKRYRYRAYPTVAQRSSLARLFGCVRTVYNDAIVLQRERRAQGLPLLNGTELQAAVVTHAKERASRAWLAEVSTVPLQQAVRAAERAHVAYFRARSRGKPVRAGAPRLKTKRTRRQSAHFTRAAYFKVHSTTHGVAKVRLPKVGWIRFRLSRSLPSAAQSVTVVREADGAYFVSFVVATQATSPGPRGAQGGRTAGVDLGVRYFASIVYDDGTRERVENPRPLRQRTRALTRAHRALARTARGSRRRRRAQERLAKQYRRVSDARMDFQHKLASRLVRENQAIAVENLNMAGLVRSRGRDRRGSALRGALMDAGLGTFARRLAQKAEEAGRVLVAVPPAGTSQRCAICSDRGERKSADVCQWKCEKCGGTVDRDFNAAVNIMVAAGLAETLNAHGGNVRLTLASAVPDEVRTHRSEHATVA